MDDTTPPRSPPPSTPKNDHTVQDSGGGKGDDDESSLIIDPTDYSKRRVKQPSSWSTEWSDLRDDGYTWRKYGQKPIPGSMYPRIYYRCTHRTNLGCKATKQVQKVTYDPPLYRTTYMGNHTCQTAPQIKSSDLQSESSLGLSIGVGGAFFQQPPTEDNSTVTTSDGNNNTVTRAMASSSSSLYFTSGNQGLPSTVLEQGEELEYHVSSFFDKLFNPMFEQQHLSIPKIEFSTAANDTDSRHQLAEHRPQSLAEMDVSEDLHQQDNFMEEMKDYFSIFFLLPTDYEFEEDSLVQLWMAMGCIEDESMGHAGFHSFLSRQYLLHSGTNFVTRKVRYRMNTTKIYDLLDGQKDIIGSFYLQWENDSQKNITSSTEIQHVSVVCNDIDASIFLTLQQFAELRTLLFLRNHGNKVTQVQDHLFLSCQKLQALDLSGTHIKKLSSFVGNLIHLRYLDLSWTLIEWLPDTICSLDELQTLKLKGCSKLRGLPRQLKKLTKLRHLDVDVLRQLATLPAGIGALVNLRTLSAFLVGTEDGCKIQELKELNSLTGDFCIAMLENVGNVDGAKEAALNKKQHLDKLELRWTASQLSRTDNNCYDVLKRLRPCSSLKELQIFCYKGSRIPDWVSDPAFYQLTSITFFNCEHVSDLPLIEELPFLKHLELVKMNGVKRIERQGMLKQAAFFRLEKLEVNEMQSLRSWNWVPTSEGDFKSLVELTISDCPSLSEFHVLPCLSSIKHLEVKGCPKLESLSDTKLPDSLEELIVEDCPMITRKCSQQGGEDWYKIQHVSNIRICEDDEDDDHDEC